MRGVPCRVAVGALLLCGPAAIRAAEIPESVNSRCATRVKTACPADAQPSDDRDQQAKCVKCIKAHIGQIQEGAPAFDFACTLADVGNICSVSEQGKSKEETEACEAELKKYCKLKMVGGPPCVTCVKEHLQRIDDGLVSDSMCSSFQLNQFCFFTGSITCAISL